jgi:hypothetical protein
MTVQTWPAARKPCIRFVGAPSSARIAGAPAHASGAQLEREVTMQTASLKLYLTEDFQEAARAFAEKRQRGRFKGR